MADAVNGGLASISKSARHLRVLALASAAYDLVLGIPLLVAAPLVARLMGSPAPVPVINAQLNGLFTITLALGYLWAAADVEARRGYLWVAGVFAKLLGAALFLADQVVRDSPSTFLVFAFADGTLGLLTLFLLLGTRR